MILSGPMIRREVTQGAIEIDPFRDEQINPASYDLTLGDRFSWYVFGGGSGFPIHDVKTKPIVRHGTIDELGIVIAPGEGFLMHTVERIRTDKYVPVIDGKSSVGRLFVKVHETAGYGDPGFDGQYTLEVTASAFAVRLYAGMRIAQIRFHAMLGEPMKYEGNYRGDAAKGPVPSALWKQFRKDGEK